MKTILKVLAVLALLVMLVVVTVKLLTPWMDRWGATENEISANLPGDELVPSPASFVNRAITIHAKPEQIYPWIVQIGAEKAGWYSHAWLEGLLNCQIVNADSIHPEWQNLQPGDLVKMCPGKDGPPPYMVANVYPDQAVVLGHQENGKWVDLWQFVIIPQTDGTSRLVLRTRTMMTGGMWDVIHPGVFIMETGMLQGIRARAEKLSQ